MHEKPIVAWVRLALDLSPRPKFSSRTRALPNLSEIRSVKHGPAFVLNWFQHADKYVWQGNGPRGGVLRFVRPQDG